MSRRYVRYGSSPRGAQALILAAKIEAILDHRYHVSRDDIRAVARPALRHRLILNFEGQAEGIAADDIIDDILETVELPVAAA
jgi:MoxR-like ATPase